MRKNILFIIPHQDDELLIGGSVLYEFAHSVEWKTYVLYSTNGAALHESPETRLEEAIQALKVIGIPEKQIIFLGYGNEWQGDYNIYNAPEDEVLTSLRGEQYTYALPKHVEFCYEKKGIHNTYTRKNYLADLKSAILEIYPKVIVAVDMDDHQEHMATSLFLDECLHEILLDEKGYFPLVLKKFAYDGLWHGKDDYFTIPRVPTLNGDYKGDKTRNPAFLWSERMRFANCSKCDTLLFCNNVLNKAICKHRSQTGWLCASRLINKDNVYWVRRTDNYALFADVLVSSGDKKHLNDFKLIDTKDVRNKDTIWSDCSWFPEESDHKKCIELSWKAFIEVKQIDIYESPEKNSGSIIDAEIVFDDGFSFNTGELIHGGSKNVFFLNKKHKVRKIQIYVRSYTGKPGISEIEVFKDVFCLTGYGLPVKEYMDKKASSVMLMLKRTINFFERKLFHLKARILLK